MTSPVTPRTPNQILADFEAGARGTADTDMMAVLHEAFDDLRSSYRLALSDLLSPDDLALVEATVDDYLGNHWSEATVATEDPLETIRGNTECFRYHDDSVWKWSTSSCPSCGIDHRRWLDLVRQPKTWSKG